MDKAPSTTSMHEAILLHLRVPSTHGGMFTAVRLEVSVETVGKEDDHYLQQFTANPGMYHRYRNRTHSCSKTAVSQLLTILVLKGDPNPNLSLPTMNIVKPPGPKS
ncbi:unnamed protein product [Aspergillus oryzae]|nr:unnamed protein product [Aspergillus oryzae]